MENEKNLQPEQEDGWFDQLLEKPDQNTHELELDESAIYAAGLTHPEDIELEKILSEAKSMDEPPEETPAEPVDEIQAMIADDLSAMMSEPQAESDVSQDTQIIPIPAFSADPEPVADPEPEPQAEEKKRRPKAKKGYGLLGIPHILSTVIWAFVVFAVGVSMGRLIWVCAADVLAFGKNPKEAIITINQSDDIDDIAKKLKKAGLIDYPQLFKMYMDFSGNDELEVGTHHLTSMIYDYHAIKTAMAPRATARDVIEVVIPEGYSCAQIFKLLEEKGVCSVKQLEDYAANGDLNEYWFLEGLSRGDKYCLEGYLFPDTYQFYKGHDPELVLEKMLDNFEYRFTDIMKAKIDTLNERLATMLRSRGYGDDYINSHAFTIHEVVTVASMIERETASGSESYDIASVIYNRLTNPASYPFLNIDATVIYGMGGARIDPNTGDSLPLTKTDLETDTPYNTYTRKGLIPGPISNPGRNSINAALDPNDTEYYFYVYKPSAGCHLFGRNEAEHEQNKISAGN